MAAYERYLEGRRAGSAQPLSAWLAAHAALGDVLDDVVLAGATAAPATTGPTGERGDAAAFAPTRIGGFTLLEECGKGGNGAVWRARGPRHEGDVALKLLHASSLRDGDVRARFFREARVAAQLDHPHLCRVVAFDEAGEPPWLAMEFVAGNTLAERFRAARGAPVDADAIASVARLVEKIAGALHFAHERGLVHRDVKPGNVMVTPGNEPVLVDFGLVRESANGGQLTVTGDRMGTPTHMSPEQIAGTEVDRRADVWALGVVLFEGLGGRLPFRASTHEAIAHAIAHRPVPDLRRLNPNVPAALALIVATALRKRASDRYPTAAQLAEDLRRWRWREPLLARRRTAARRAWQWGREHPLPAALLVTRVAALLAVGWFARGAVRFATRDSLARAAALESRAECAFDAGRVEPDHRRWAGAEAGHAQAQDLGCDEPWDARLRADLWLPSLARPSMRTDQGPDRAIVLSAGRLPLAPEHLVRALRLGPRRGFADEASGTPGLFRDGPAAARDAARVDHKVTAFLEAMALGRLGRSRETGLPAAARAPLASLPRLRVARGAAGRERLYVPLAVQLGMSVVTESRGAATAVDGR